MKKFIVLILTVMMLTLSLSGISCFYVFADVSDKPELAADSAVLMDADTGEILYDKNMDKTQYPASTTKIMTALLAIENLDYDDTVTVSRRAADVVIEGANLDCKYGEQFRVKDVVYGLMLHSANEMAVILAEAVSGSEANFAELMNERAEEIGCTGTHFVTPNGLPDARHVTTAHDLALIAREAMQNEKFAEVVATVNYTIPATNMSEARDVKNSNFMLYKRGKLEVDGVERPYKYDGLKGIKTGYTNAAQGCLVEEAERKDLDLLCVTLHSENDMRFQDAIKLLDWGFKNYKMKTLIPSDEEVASCEVRKGSEKKVAAVPVSDIRVCVEKTSSGAKLDREDYTWKVQEKSFTAPVKKGKNAGQLKLYKEGRLIGVYDLETQEEVELSWWRRLLKKVIH